MARLTGQDEYLSAPTLVAFVIVLVAAVLRLYHLAHESFWLDEAITWLYVTREYTTVELLTTLPMQDVHPPLYYLLIDGWTAIVGTSELAFRLPSAVFGIATVGLLYLVGAKAFDRWSGAIAAMLLSVTTFHLYYSQEARMYSMLAFLTLLSFYFFVDLALSEEYGRWTLLGYVLASVLLVYTHVYGLFILVAQNAYLLPVLVLQDREIPGVGRLPSRKLSLRTWLAIDGILVGIALPWLVILFYRMPTISGGGCPSINWIPHPTTDMLSTTVARYLFYCGPPEAYEIPFIGSEFSRVFFPVLVSLVVGFAAFGVVARRVGSERGPSGGAKFLVLLWFLVPLLVPFVLSLLVTPIIVPRYTIGATLALFLLFGKGIQSLQPYAPTVLRIFLAAVVIIGVAAPLVTYYEKDQKQQWREVVESVESRADAEATIIVRPDPYEIPYQYYSSVPDDRVTGIASQANRSQVGATIQNADSVWLVLPYAGYSQLLEHVRSLDYRVEESETTDNVQIYHFVKAE